jgi:hypothetical protein
MKRYSSSLAASFALAFVAVCTLTVLTASASSVFCHARPEAGVNARTEAVHSTASLPQSLPSLPSVEQFINAEDILALRKTMIYPRLALDMQQRGRFDILAFVGANGEILAVNFELKNEQDDASTMRYLIDAATQAVGKYQFSEQYHNTVVRIPFNFRMI